MSKEPSKMRYRSNCVGEDADDVSCSCDIERVADKGTFQGIEDVFDWSVYWPVRSSKYDAVSSQDQEEDNQRIVVDIQVVHDEYKAPVRVVLIEISRNLVDHIVELLEVCSSSLFIYPGEAQSKVRIPTNGHDNSNRSTLSVVVSTVTSSVEKEALAIPSISIIGINYRFINIDHVVGRDVRNTRWPVSSPVVPPPI